ncbi:MAG TPA: hypothetical protein VI299_19720 [Polyangiales bacterium]
MARLQLSGRDLDLLRACATAALEGKCIPDWEFEALFGCSRMGAKRTVDAAVRRIEGHGERPQEQACERLVLLLSALRGTTQGQDAQDIGTLIGRLSAADDTHRARCSGVTLRAEATGAAHAQRR